MNRRSIAAIVVASLAALALIGGAYWLGSQSPDKSGARPAAAAPTPSRSTTTPTTSPTATSSAQPDYPGAIIVARKWLQARYTLHADDPAPDAWIARVAPLSTDTLQATLEKKFGGGSGGIAWANFVQQRCSRTVGDLQAQISPEAPETKTSKWLRVTGVATTHCAVNPKDPPFPAEKVVRATLQLTKQPSGAWRVNDRIRAG